MHPLVLQEIDKVTPRPNPLIANGYSTECMKEAIRYIDQIWKLAQRAFPKGMTYDGYEIANPKEQFYDTVRERSTTRSRQRFMETAENNFTMVKFYLSYNGERLYRRPSASNPSSLSSDFMHIYIPYLERANTFKLKGSTYTVSPVIIDNGLSISRNSIHIAPAMVKMNIFLLNHHVKVNDNPQMVKLPYSNFYNKAAPKEVLTKSEPTLASYVFSKYGLKKSLEMFCNISDFKVFDSYHDAVGALGTDDYDFYHSSGIRPKTIGRLGIGKVYVSSKVTIAIPKKDASQKLTNYMGNFFYIVDHFPDRFEASYLENFEEEEWVFKACLGFVHFPDDIETKRIERVNKHLESVDIYIDPIASMELQHSGIEVSDTYELFDNLIETMDQRLLDASKDAASMYDKRLVILNYFLSDIKDMIFKFVFSLQRIENINFDNLLRYVQNQTDFKPDKAIYSLGTGHNELEIYTSPGDCFIPKVTARLTLQENATARNGKKEMDGSDPKDQRHFSLAEVNVYCAAPKSNPGSRDRVNCYLHVDEMGFVKPNPKFNELREKTSKLLERN